MFFKIIIFLNFINLLINFNVCNGSIIEKNGDYLFAYFSDLIYDPLAVKQNQFLSIGNECLEWEVVWDSSKILAYKSYKTDNLIISFKSNNNINIEDNAYYFKADCFIDPKGCGQVRNGFQGEYYDIYDQLYSLIESCKKPYDIYFTGHSVGGVIAFFAMLDISIQRFNEKYIKSITCITFGQPAIGDDKFLDYVKLNNNKFTYRRYVTLSFNNTIRLTDPYVSNTIFKHSINNTVYLKNQNHQIFSNNELHFLDVYLENLKNEEFSLCNNNCKFKKDNAFINFREYHQSSCDVNGNTEITMSINPLESGFQPFTYSVCLLESKEAYNYYKYSTMRSCSIRYGQTSTILLDRINNKYQFSQKANGKHVYIIIENQNLDNGNYSLTYNLSFSNQLQQPLPPQIINCTIEKQYYYSMNVSISFKSNSFSNETSDQIIKYVVYFSKSDNTWLRYKISKSINTEYVTMNYNIPNGKYSVIITSYNGIESKPSNIGFIH
ncbi:hypothetical protein RB653_002063 [Dictyostelium firmibasis]|uniref:Fibronectin type-III domain-containing protein n=1 Tax=Dictyostelium firmibasis TaxID=79012 RepID=A0AAN7U2F4_9MYCE